MFKDISYAIIQWLIILIIRIPLILMGLIIVPIALLFRKSNLSTSRFFTDYNTHRRWMLVTLPKWAWLWSNDRDGAIGDKRGWWDKNCKSGNAYDFYSMFWWLAVRNPVNNMRFVKGLSCDVSKSKVSVLYGDEYVDDKVGFTGIQFLKAKGPIFNYYQFYWVRPNKNDPTKAFIIRFGHKIKINHNDQDWTKLDETKRWKGFTFRIGFNKDIT